VSFTFQRNADGTLTVRDAVMQALGRASVCWSTPEGAGVFDATAAEEVGNVLLETLDEWLRAELRAVGVYTFAVPRTAVPITTPDSPHA
jgi:hypothetical protein